MERPKSISVRVECVDSRTVVLRGISKADVDRARLVIEWRGQPPHVTHVPLPYRLDSDGAVRVSVDDLVWALSPSFRTSDPDAEPKLVLMDDRKRVAVAGEALTLPKQVQDMLQPPRAGERRSPDRNEAARERGRIVRVGWVRGSVALDFSGISGLSDPNPTVTLFSTDESVDHDRAIHGRLKLRCPAVGYHKYGYDVVGSDGRSRGLVHLLVLPTPSVLALVLAALLALIYFGVIVPMTRSTLRAGDVDVSLEAGTQEIVCLDGKAKYPSTYGRLSLPAQVAGGKVKIKGAPRGIGCREQVTVTADADTPTGSYPTEYGVGTALFEERGKFVVNVGDTTRLDANDHVEACLEQGQSTSIDLQSYSVIKLKDQRERISLATRQAKGGSIIDVEQRPPFRVRFRATRISPAMPSFNMPSRLDRNRAGLRRSRSRCGSHAVVSRNRCRLHKRRRNSQRNNHRRNRYPHRNRGQARPRPIRRYPFKRHALRG